MSCSSSCLTEKMWALSEADPSSSIRAPPNSSSSKHPFTALTNTLTIGEELVLIDGVHAVATACSVSSRCGDSRNSELPFSSIAAIPMLMACSAANFKSSEEDNWFTMCIRLKAII